MLLSAETDSLAPFGQTAPALRCGLLCEPQDSTSPTKRPCPLAGGLAEPLGSTGRGSSARRLLELAGGAVPGSGVGLQEGLAPPGRCGAAASFPTSVLCSTPPQAASLGPGTALVVATNELLVPSGRTRAAAAPLVQVAPGKVGRAGKHQLRKRFGADNWPRVLCLNINISHERFTARKNEIHLFLSRGESGRPSQHALRPRHELSADLLAGCGQLARRSAFKYPKISFVQESLATPDRRDAVDRRNRIYIQQRFSRRKHPCTKLTQP